MDDTSRRIRLGVAAGVYILFAAAVLAALVFDTTLFADLGPLTGVWLGFVLAGNVALAVVVVAGWYLYWRANHGDRPEEREG